MNRIALAANGYMRRLPQPGPACDYFSFPGARLSQYLARDVVPAVDELLRLPAFRSLAGAPVEMLAPGSESRVRPLIDEFKQTLCATVDQCLEFVDQHASFLEVQMDEAVRRWRRVRFPNLPPIRPTRSDADGDAVRDETALEVLRLRLQGLRQSCDEEWVSGDDYFGPFFNVHQEVEGERIQRGEFVVAFSDELAYVGNFVARCLLVRSNTALKVLQELAEEINATFVAAERRAAYPWTAPQQELECLGAGLRNELLLTEQATLTEAAMTLVQIHAEFAAAPPTYDWLPVANWIVHCRRGSLRRILESKRDCETAEQIGHALQLIRKWRDERPSLEAALEAAIAAGGLVIDEGGRKVYWESRLIEADWSRGRAWDLLRRLALNRRRSFLAEHDFYADDKDRAPSTYSVLKNKLLNMLPATLRPRIVVAPKRGGYQLDLDSASVQIFSATKIA